MLYALKLTDTIILSISGLRSQEKNGPSINCATALQSRAEQQLFYLDYRASGSQDGRRATE
jgi:hypothetical protein